MRLRTFKNIIAVAVLVMAIMYGLMPSANAQSIIRDTEIENTIKKWFTPVVEAARMDIGGVRIIIVNDPQLNAFVAGGPNIFVFTGLILETETPDELIGVLAHELGHISGGHLIRGRDAMERASYESVLGSIIGIGAAILTGESGAAGAITSGAQSTALRGYLAHSRVQEASADQAALTYLDGAGINPSGLTGFLEKLQRNEVRSQQTQDVEYLRTHPLTEKRIQLLENAVQNSSHYNSPVPDDWIEEHKRMKAKILAFMEPGQVVWTYDDRDMSVPAKYARAIAAYRLNGFENAISQIDNLIKQEPDNPYFYELKGQVLFDFGKIKDAAEVYKTADNIKKDSGLIKISYAQALIESGRSNTENINTAIRVLKSAETLETRSSYLHRLLATAYGINGQDAHAKLHLAEEAVLKRKWDIAKQMAKQAKDSFPENSREWIQAEDILGFVKQHGKDEDAN